MTLQQLTRQQLLDLRREMLALVDCIERVLIAKGELSGPPTAQLRKEYKSKLSPQQTVTSAAEIEISTI